MATEVPSISLLVERAAAEGRSADQVADALRQQGHKVSILGAHGDPKKLLTGLSRRKPELVFNLMEVFGKNARGDDLGELLRVRAGVRGVGAADAEHFEHGGLGLQDGAAADGADFDGGHGDGDLEVAV